MADDIDIEEHDILENPRFKDILADCAIKTEPLELNTEEYEDPSQNYQDYEYYQAPDYPELEESSYQEYGEMSTDSYAETLTHSVDATFQNRIILGTKPCSQSVSPIIGTSNSQDPIILNTQGSVVFGTKPSPKLRKAGELDAQAPIILNTQGSVYFGTKACPKSKKTGLLGTSQDGIVRNSTSFGTKPCPKSRKASQSQMVFNPMVFGTKLCPVTRKPMIEDTGSYGVPFADNSLIIGTKPCPKSRKPQLTSTSKNLNTQELTVSTIEAETGPNKINFMATESSDYSDFERSSESNLCQNSCTDTISDPEKSHPLLRYLLDKGAKDPAPIAPKPIRVLEDAIVVLENWGPRLQTSQCYCDQCGTLFATRNALDFHNMTSHSFLVAMDEPVAEETNQKHEKFCNQCHTYFTDDNLLIQHLYEHLTASSTATVEPEKLFYKCPICFSYYASHTRFVKHTLRNHNTTFEDVKLVNFRTFCNICSKKTTVMSHNKHIQEVHKSYYVRKVKTDDKKALNKAKEVSSERKGPIKLSIKRNQSGKLILKVLPKVGKVIPKVGKVIPKVGPGGKLLKFKNVNVGNIPLTRRNNVATYKCTKCKLFYASRKGVLTHINKKHPSEKTLVQVTGRPATGRQPTGRPMTGRSPVSKNKGTGERGTNQFDFYKSKVPKDVVFKCKTCHVHLLCSIAIHMHESKCMKYKIERTKSKNIYDCKKCGNTFRNVDRAIHDEQHLRANRIKIYEITDNFYARLLYKCEGCNVFFEEKRFLKHCAEDCHYEPSEWCPKCKINVDSASRHDYRHTSDNLSRSDFILIDRFIAIDKSSTPKPTSSKMSLPTVSTSKSVISPPKTGALKRKLVSEDPNTGKRAKVPIKLYYCTLCRNFSKLLTWRNYHVSKACLTQKVAGKNCVYCGLPFRAGMPIRRHQDDHRIYKWKFSDFAFHNMNGETPITPPIPMFPTCKRCGVHYTGDVHDCRSEKRNCSICKRKFNAPAYKLHQLHHKYLENETETMDDVTELIQKYESLKSTWNIIYYCAECDVATDAYDRAVEHAQKHIASCLGSEDDRATCDICCINFDSASIEKHEELHTNENIDKSSFNILTYNYTEFLTDKWFDLFRNLSQAEIKQITFSSVYVTRFVKMNMILNGPPEFTLYKCECCKNYVEPSNVYNHTRVCDEGGRQRAYHCDVCTIPFSSADGLKQHKGIHQNTDVTANSYRIVSFNAKADKDFNTKLEVEPEIEKQNIKFTFLRCSKCNCCSSKGEFFRAHNCSPKVTFLWSCGACPFVTKASHAKAHERWHRENRNIKSHEIDFIRFGGSEFSETEGNDIPPNKLFVWFQCQRCEVLISSCPKRHECSANPLRTCPKCEYKFSLKSYSFHMYEHERTKDLNRDTIHVIPLKSSGYDVNELTSDKLGISIAETSVEPDHFDDEEDMTNPDLSTDLFRSDTCDEEGIAFKCSCGLHFTSEQATAKHKDICSPTQTVLSENCTKCGLLYPRDVFLSHFCNREGSTDTRCHKLIKCYECRCLFPSIAEFSEHGRKKLCDDSKGARCEGCGLVFHGSTIARHRTTHAAPDDSYKNNNRIVTLHVKTSLTLYKCKKCNIHLMEEVSYRRHLQLCMKKTLDYCCTDCGLHFPLKSKYKHIWAHHTVSELTAQDFIIYHKDKGVEHLKTYLKDKKDLDSSSGDKNGELIVPDAIEPISDNSEVRRPKFKNYTYNNICYDCNLYKCCCGLYYFSKELFETHSESDHTEAKEWCSKCGFVFTPDLLIEHTKVHHDRMGLETEDFVVFTKEDGRFSLKRKRDIASDPVQSNCVYECGSCQLHFTSAQSTITHLRNCGESKLEEDCSKCGLKFSSTCLVKHKTLHHGDLNYGLDDIHIFIVSKFQEVVDKTSSSDSILDEGLNMNDSVSNVSVKCEGSDFEKTSPSSTCAKTNEGKSFKHAIYKCEKCRVYFLSRTSIYNHLFRDHDRGPHHPCKLCGFKFTFKSLLSHQKMHHRKGCSINVYNIRQSGKKFKCTVCGESFMHLATLLSHFESGIHSTEQRVFLSAESDIDQKSVKNTSVSEDNTESDKISPSNTSADRANIDDSIDEVTSEVDKPSEDTVTCNDVSAVTQSNDSDVPASNKPLKIEAKSSVVRLYKCGECNVFFMNQATCSKHVMYQHTVMDSKEYIECKLCSLPFRIMSLARHIKMHHKSDFELSKVLVEEYHPKKEGEQTPKIDIYYAIDKVQSRLVSTTTDDEKVDGKSNRVTQSNIEDSLSDSVIPTDSIKREITTIEDKDNIVDSNERLVEPTNLGQNELGQCDKAKSINSEKARAISESNIHIVPESDGAPSSSFVNKTNVPERESNSLNLKKSATSISSESVQNDVFEISTITQIKLELIENE